MTDNLKKCGWCLGNPIYEDYHDNEWGTPLLDEVKLFEFLMLETFQAGLSWIMILKKRENFRKAFDTFDYKKIATYNEVKVSELIEDKGIIRNKLKINATIHNANRFIEVQKKHGSFSDFIWKFVNHKPIVNKFKAHTECPAYTSLSDEISKSLKQHNFKFVGSTIVYAFMQAIGMVNDHETSCFRYSPLVNFLPLE